MSTPTPAATGPATAGVTAPDVRTAESLLEAIIEALRWEPADSPAATAGRVARALAMIDLHDTTRTQPAAEPCWDCEGTTQIVIGWTNKSGTDENQYGPCPSCSPATAPGNDTAAAVAAALPISESAAAEYTQALRADRAEAALAEAERKLARLLSMADAWESSLPKVGRTEVLVEAVRMVIRPHL